MTLPERNTAIFCSVERSFWEYYRELEDDFLATRKYVSFSIENGSTFSLEYLKLFQATCSEVDVVGKAMAASCNPSFKSCDKRNNILKWWYEIQNVYCCYDDPTSAVAYKNGTMLSRCVQTLYCGEEIELRPWSGFETEWYLANNGSRRCRLKKESHIPDWWSAYNKVKHNRVSATRQNVNSVCFSKANLLNLMKAFAGLFVLERSFLEAVGTLNDLESFANKSKLFDKRQFATAEEISRMFYEIAKD